MSGPGVGAFLAEATGLEAQLALSYLIWPGDAPAPRVVDEWLRRQVVTSPWRCDPQYNGADSDERHPNDLVEVNPVPAGQGH